MIRRLGLVDEPQPIAQPVLERGEERLTVRALVERAAAVARMGVAIEVGVGLALLEQ